MDCRRLPRTAGGESGCVLTPKPAVCRGPNVSKLTTGESQSVSGNGRPRAQTNSTQNTSLPGREVKAVKLADVEHKPIQSDWPNRLYRGKLHLLVADPGKGKSAISTWLGARFTCGDQWPATSGSAPRGTAVFMLGEDSVSDTLKPRMEANKGNVSHVVALTEVLVKA